MLVDILQIFFGLLCAVLLVFVGCLVTRYKQRAINNPATWYIAALAVLCWAAFWGLGLDVSTLLNSAEDLVLRLLVVFKTGVVIGYTVLAVGLGLIGSTKKA